MNTSQAQGMLGGDKRGTCGGRWCFPRGASVAEEGEEGCEAAQGAGQEEEEEAQAR